MGIVENIKGREVAMELFDSISSVILDEVKNLPCSHSKEVFWKSLAKFCNDQIEPEKTTVIKEKKKVLSPKETDIDDLVEEIKDLIDEVPGNGVEYAESCLETTNSIYRYYEEKGRVSPAQLRALENIKNGLKRWVRDE